MYQAQEKRGEDEFIETKTFLLRNMPQVFETFRMPEYFHMELPVHLKSQETGAGSHRELPDTKRAILSPVQCCLPEHSEACAWKEAGSEHDSSGEWVGEVFGAGSRPWPGRLLSPWECSLSDRQHEHQFTSFSSGHAASRSADGWAELAWPCTWGAGADC
jgi:hypothetical protein